MRGVPVPLAVTFLSATGAFRRDADRLAVVLASAAAGYGGDRRRPVTGAAERGSRRAVGLASEGRGESCRPATASPRVNLAAYGGSPWPLFPLGCSRPSSLFTAGTVRPGAPKACP